MKRLLWTLLSTGIISGAFYLSGCNAPSNNTNGDGAAGGTTNVATGDTGTGAADGSKDGGNQTANGKKLKIAVIPKGLAHAFWQSVHSGAKTAADEFDVEISWNGPAQEADVPRQATIVETAITQGVDGIVLAPIDRKALVGAINKAAAAKVPVVIFDSDADTNNKISFIATDNYRGGEMAAQRMAEILKGQGTVIVVPVQPNSQSTGDREKGFEDYLRKKFPKIKVVRSNYGMSDRKKSMDVTENKLTAYPDAVGIFGPNESSAVGALQAVRARKLAGKIKIVGFDTADILVDALKSGDIDSLVVQNPNKMGYEGVKAIVDYKNGKKVPPRIDTGVAIITKADMNTPENQKLLLMK